MQEIVLSSENDARTVLDTLRKLLDKYKEVTVADYLELVGGVPNFEDERVGWTELGDISIKSVPNGFTLDLPEPKKLNIPTVSAFPFLKGWWFVVDVPDDQKYEGWLVDELGGTMIIESESSKVRLGIQTNTVNKIDAYRERPSI